MNPCLWVHEGIVHLLLSMASLSKLHRNYNRFCVTREVTGYSSRRDAYPPAEGCPRSGCSSRGEAQRRGKKEVLRIFQMKCFFVSLPYALASSNLPRRRATLYQLRWLSKGLRYRFADASRHATSDYTPPSRKNVEGAASPHETDVPSSDVEGSLSKSNVSYCRDGLPKLISKAYGIRVARR